MSSEHFTQGGKDLELDLANSEGRRQRLFRLLEAASHNPEVLRTGLDTSGFEDLQKEAGATSFAHFSKDIKYAPVALAENMDEGELNPELQAVKQFMPFLRETLRKKMEELGIDMQPIESQKIIIGFAKKNPDQAASLVGGYHADLEEQGYKFYDAISQANPRFDTNERLNYRIADLLRSVAHDAIHSLQYKRFNRINEKSEPLPLTEDTLNARLEQFGTFFSGTDKAPIGDEAPPISISILEWSTDEMAREIVERYLTENKNSLPDPETPLEKLSRKDLRGEIIREEDIAGLNQVEEKIARHMVRFGEIVIKPAEETLSLFGSLRPTIEKAVQDATFSGKFNRLQELGKDLNAAGFKLEDGTQLDSEVIKKMAMRVLVFRPLFPGTDWKELERLDGLQV